MEVRGRTWQNWERRRLTATFRPPSSPLNTVVPWLPWPRTFPCPHVAISVPLKWFRGTNFTLMPLTGDLPTGDLPSNTIVPWRPCLSTFPCPAMPKLGYPERDVQNATHRSKAISWFKIHIVANPTLLRRTVLAIGVISSSLQTRTMANSDWCPGADSTGVPYLQENASS